MRVKTFMSSPVHSVLPTAPVGDAAAFMLEHHVSGLPVVSEDGILVGIVTEGDFLRRGELGSERKRSRWLEFFTSLNTLADEYVHTHGRTIAEVMSPEVATIGPDAQLAEAVELMLHRHIKRLPVVEGGKVVGILSRSDVLRALAGELRIHQSAPLGDDVIAAVIRDQLAKQTWNTPGTIRADVEDGRVTLVGTIFDDRQRGAARVLAENVPGVKSVTDQLIWVEPMSGTVIPAPEPDHKSAA